MSLYPLNSTKHACAERHFIKALGWEARGVTLGVTTPEIRRDRLQEFILANALADVAMWKTADGASETYREAWERLYGLPFSETDTIDAPTRADADRVPVAPSHEDAEFASAEPALLEA